MTEEKGPAGAPNTDAAKSVNGSTDSVHATVSPQIGISPEVGPANGLKPSEITTPVETTDPTNSIPAPKDVGVAGIESGPDAGSNGNGVQQHSISASPPSIAAGIKTAWLPVPISKLTGGGPLPWVWHGYVARGFATVLVGLFEAGKLTLVAWLLRAMAAGGDVAGPVTPGRVLVVTEEGPALWSRRRDELKIGDHVEVICRPFKGRPAWTALSQFIEFVALLVTAQRYDVVIIDTLAGFLPVTSDNDAAEMLRALTPLHCITEAGAGLLLVHHPRKGDGSEGTASRGSGALPGFADAIVELRRYAPKEASDCRRTLTGLSRFDETPAEVVVELTDAGYRMVGVTSDAKQSDRFDAIRRLLPTTGPGLTVEQILAAWPTNGVPKPGERTLRADLAKASGLMSTGDGTKGSPKRYFRQLTGVEAAKAGSASNRSAEVNEASESPGSIDGEQPPDEIRYDVPEASVGLESD